MESCSSSVRRPMPTSSATMGIHALYELSKLKKINKNIVVRNYTQANIYIYKKKITIVGTWEDRERNECLRLH